MVLKNVKRKHNNNFKVLLQSPENRRNFLLLPSPLLTTILLKKPVMIY